MMSWNSFYFSSPSSFYMSNLILFHEHLLMFLFSIMMMVIFYVLIVFYMKDFYLNLFENHELEILWTIFPVFILLAIIFPSISLLYYSDSCVFCGFTVFIIGHQWYWSYIYKNILDLIFNSYMIQPLSSNIRLLEVDNNLVLPFSLPLRFLGTSMDVIHSWTIPSLGIKMDVIPGRLSQSCISMNRSGIFFGQCSEICGINHSFMPVVLESVSLKSFLIGF